MANLPFHRTVQVTRHEWIISNDGDPIDARTLTDGIYAALKNMEKLGVEISYDDAYYVVTTDENEIILCVEISEEKLSNA